MLFQIFSRKFINWSDVKQWILLGAQLLYNFVCVCCLWCEWFLVFSLYFFSFTFNPLFLFFISSEIFLIVNAALLTVINIPVSWKEICQIFIYITVVFAVPINFWYLVDCTTSFVLFTYFHVYFLMLILD